MIVDLFAGPGGWSEAVKSLGLAEIGVEYDGAACATRAAAGHRTIRADVAQYPAERFAGYDGVIASPPCQAFSAAGRGHGRDVLPDLAAAILAGDWSARPDPDPRVWLVLEVGRWVEAVGPRWVACEQVPAVLPLWDAYARLLRTWGFETWAGLVHCEQFGVPQTRTRAVLVASRDGVREPVPTHQRYRHGQPARREVSLFGELAPWVSMADALCWGNRRLRHERRFRSSSTSHATVRSEVEPAPTITASMDNGDAKWVVLTENFTGSKSGESWQDRRYERPIDEPSPTVGSRGDQWVVDRRTTDHRPDGTRTPTATVPVSVPAPTLAQADKWVIRRPATTVMGDSRLWPPGHKVNQGDADRLGAEEATERYGDRAGSEAVTLTEAEGLILQGFRPDYPVRGNKSQRWQQIGNAFPPPAARAVLECVL